MRWDGDEIGPEGPTEADLVKQSRDDRMRGRGRRRLAATPLHHSTGIGEGMKRFGYETALRTQNPHHRSGRSAHHGAVYAVYAVYEYH